MRIASEVPTFLAAPESKQMTFKRCALAAILLATPAHAQWPSNEYTGENETCVANCDKGNPGAHAKCAATCRCVMDSLQTQFPNYAQIEGAYQQKDTAAMAAIQKTSNSCNQKFFGADARTIK